MTHARPNALSLAMAFAISSSIINTQALADRRLQIKSIDIQGNGQPEFTQIEVMVKPTLGHDQKPIPNSFTTTYPDQTQARANYEVPSEGFTDILSGIEGGVSSVDQFETDENDVARKYTKVLKVGNEGVFKFTHNLADEALIIEVRNGMTHQDSIKAVRSQSGDIQPLEPTTKVASPEHLVGVLKGAHERAGSLGEADHYVALATMKVGKVEVNERTFMRLIAAGDELPELQRLGQSLFVNDEALFALATSAYTQVYLLGEGLQKVALNTLLLCHQPVGYVVHVEDVTQAYPVPEGYPKLEVTEAPGEIIVFRGQKQNLADIAFVESLYNPWKKFNGNNKHIAQVKKDKVKSYQYVIRSRQMALLEGFSNELALQHHAELLHDKLVMLAYYESIQQALTTAASYGTDEFELTAEHIGAVLSVITPGWMLVQFEKLFSFKPALRDLLTSRHFFQNVQKGTDVISKLMQRFAFGEDTTFVKKAIGNMARQHLELENTLKEPQGSEAFQQYLQQQNTRKDAEKATEIKDRYATIAAHLNIQNFNSNDDVDAQQESPLAKIKTMIAQKELHSHRIRTINEQQDLENSDIITAPGQSKAMPEVLETLRAMERVLGDKSHIDERDDVYFNRQLVSEDIHLYVSEARQREEAQVWIILQMLEDRLSISFRIGESDSKAAKLARVRARLDSGDVSKDELADMHRLLRVATDRLAPEGSPMQMDVLVSGIRDLLNFLIEESDQRARKRQTNLLIALEDALNISPHENPAAKEREKMFIAKLASDLQIGFADDANLFDQQHALRDRIQELKEEVNKTYDDEGVKRIRNNQIADQLNIKNYRYHATIDEQNSLIKAKLEDLDEEVFKAGQPEVDERIAAIENELDRQMPRLGPKPRFVLDRDVATTRRAIKEAESELAAIYRNLKRLRGTSLVYEGNPDDLQDVSDEESMVLKQGMKEVQIELGLASSDEQTTEERVKNIRHFLLECSAEKRDKILQELRVKSSLNIHMINDLGSEEASDYLIAIARYADSAGQYEVGEALGRLLHSRKRYIQITDFLREHDDALLEAIEKDVGLKPAPADTHEQRLNALRKRQVEYGGNDGYGGTVRHLIQEQADLQDEIEFRKADIERMKRVLKAAEQAVESDSGPFQYTPEQVMVLSTINNFMQQHPLKKQALEAAIGLKEAAREGGKKAPLLSTFDFNNEFAAIRMQALVGDKLTFEQASRMVDVFKSLKIFPESPLMPMQDRPWSAIKNVEELAGWALHYVETGAQQYDNVIRDMGKTVIHFVEHEPRDLKGFPEYFASHSASGNKIITLLREGLISRVELEHYIKAVRGVGVYTAMGEFEHFIGSKHGVRVPQFRRVVRMLSDKGAEEFMQSAFIPVTVTATGPTGMKESVAGIKEYAVAIIANYVLDDIAFENGRRTAAFLANVQDTLTLYVNAAGLSESELIKAIHDTLMQTHSAAVEWQLNDYWVKPSASLLQAFIWYYSNYNPLLVTHTAPEAARLSLSNMAFLYLLDLTNRGDYTHRLFTPFQHWLERYGVDLDRNSQYAYHSGIEKISEAGGLAMPLGKAASSVILLKTGTMLFARQHNANPRMYCSISRLVPEMVKSMGSGQGVQVPLLHRVTPQKVKTLASATAGLVLGPLATVGAYAHGLISRFTYAQTFELALMSSLGFDFLMNDNKVLTQWLGGSLGRSLDKLNRWRGTGETESDYMKRTAIDTPQRFNETDEEYANRVKTNNMMHGWTRKENYLQFRKRRDRTMKMYENGWEKYFRDNTPKWSFSHAESIPYSYTLGIFYDWQQSDDNRATAAPEAAALNTPLADQKFDPHKNENTRSEL